MKKFFLTVFLLSLFLVWSFWHKLATMEQTAMDATLIHTQKEVLGELDKFGLKLNDFFKKSEASINSIAASLDKEEPDYSKLISDLNEVLNENQCTAIGAHFSDEYDKQVLNKYFSKYSVINTDKTLYAPFFTKESRPFTTFPYDYTETGPESQNLGWYSEKEKKGFWFGPYFGVANKKFVISYSAPFGWDESKGRNKGNVCADYSLESLQQRVAEIGLLSSGYGIILTDDGTIISHPVKEYLALNISDISNLDLNMDLLKNIPEEEFHELGVVSPQSSYIRERLILRKTISDRKWTVLVILNKDETLVQNSKLSKESSEAFKENSKSRTGYQHFQSLVHAMKVKLILAVILSCFILCILIFINSKKRYWYISSSFLFYA